MTGADLSHLVAVVPVRSLSGAKSRLGEPLDPEERADLIIAFLRRTIAAALGSRSVRSVAVVSQDPDLLRQAGAMGAEPLLQSGDGLNEALAQTRDEACAEATAILVLPVDLPAVSAEEIDRLAAAAAEARLMAMGRPVVVLVPDRGGTGTNALLLSPPDVIPFRFGEQSRAAHKREAAAAGASYVEVGGPLAFDVDTPDDLLEADNAGLGHESGR